LRTNGHDRIDERPHATGEPTDRHRAYARATLSRLCDDLAGMAEGRRNTELNKAAVRIGHMVASGWIDRAEVEHELETAALACGLHRTEIRTTLRSGLEKGLEEPCREPKDRPRHRPTAQPEQENRQFGKTESEKNKTTLGWREHVFTAADLKEKKFDPIAYVVPKLFPEGLTILAGRPKVGKSWLALDVALAIAGGRYVLGDLKLEEGDVLYAALEDNQRRLRSRIDRILSASGQTWPARLTLATKWQRLDKGGVSDAREWARSVERPRLVIFDTLAGVRPDRLNKDTLYEGDYRALTELQTWLNEVPLGGLLLHHTRKMEAEDPIDSISGSLGLTGCADTAAVLARTGKGPTLYVRGRDVEEQELAIAFNKTTCRWTVMGDAEEVHQSEIRQKIVTVLTDVTLASQPMGPKEIANLCDVREDTVRQRLPGMVHSGQIIKVSRGSYIAASRPDLLSVETRHNRHNVTTEAK
jgi:hypothetical protein